MRLPAPVAPMLLALLAACAARPPAPREAPAAVAPPAAQGHATHALEREPAGKLPEGVEPLRYALTLEIVPGRARFRGEVDVRVRLDAPRDALWLHGQGLDVTRAEVRPDAGPARAARWVPGARSGVAALRWEGAVGPGEVTLRLAYDAPFDRQLEGLYRVDSGGDAYAFTQFEAVSARRAFPCFDEPRFKTPFDVTLVVAGDDRAITNAPEVASTPRGGGLRAVRFAPTEPLPTYLLAFAVGPLDVVDAPPIPANAVRATPLPLRGVAARGRGRWLQRALGDAPALVRAMEVYFDRAFPYPKLDLIAVPDFAAGAMENAGAITFREPLLLVRPDAPADQARAVDNVLSHELAHHWFGDLVTLRWWDDIWLNESFATWMGTRTTEEVFPEHRQALALVAGVHGAMAADSLSTAVPVRRPIATDDDLRGGSSAIVYQKGAAVLGMVEGWLGEGPFRDALRRYLRAHEHGTATGADLFAALATPDAQGALDATLRAFIEQPGVPTLDVDLACDASGRRVTVSQRRFALPAGARPGAGAWTVPVCVRYPDGAGGTARTCGRVEAPRGEIALGPGRCPAWLMPNADARGYYRWSLPPARRAALVAQGWTRLSPAERLSVVNNARAAFTEGTLDFAALRPVLARAAADPERLVAVEPLGFWLRAIDDELPAAAAQAARREAARLYAPAWAALGWTPRPNEGAERALFRGDLGGFLGLVANDASVGSEGARRGARYLAATADDPAIVARELAGAAVVMHLRAGGEAAVVRVIERALASDDALLRSRLLAALGHAPEPWLAGRVLPLSLDPRLRVNEVFTALSAALGRAETREAAFAWLAAHADDVFARVSVNARTGTPWLGARFCDLGAQARVRALFEPRLASAPGSEVQLRGALEAIAVCAAERDRQGPGLAAAFAGAPR